MRNNFQHASANRGPKIISLGSTRMTAAPLIAAWLILVFVLGCGGKESGGEGSSPKVKAVDGIVKVLVEADGTVLINSKPISQDDLAETLRVVDSVEEVWYFRESPNTPAAHEKGLQVLADIETRGVPLEMFLDREFKTRSSDIF